MQVNSRYVSTYSYLIYIEHSWHSIMKLVIKLILIYEKGVLFSAIQDKGEVVVLTFEFTINAFQLNVIYKKWSHWILSILKLHILDQMWIISFQIKYRTFIETIIPHLKRVCNSSYSSYLLIKFLLEDDLEYFDMFLT